MVLEKTLESPLDCKEIQPVHSEGDQPWDFFGRNDAKAETPLYFTPNRAKNLRNPTANLDVPMLKRNRRISGWKIMINAIKPTLTKAPRM